MLNEVSKIHRNTGIFLLKKTTYHPIMYGVFLADGPPGRDLEPLLLGGNCPAQVRVKQCFKFSPLPWSTFKGMFEGNNAKGVKRGLRITAEQTLDLITKFIIATRIVLTHRVVSNLSGDIGKQIKQIDADWVRDRMLLLQSSLDWQKKVITGGAIPFRFVPAFMAQGGTIDDFIWAVRSLEEGKEHRNTTKFFHEYWKKFLYVIQELDMLNGYVEDSEGFANQMEDLMSILSQTSSPVGNDHVAIQAPRCCSHRAAGRSCMRPCEAPNLPQSGGPMYMERRPNYAAGYPNSEWMSPYGWQQPPQCSFNYPSENNYVFNSAPWSIGFRDEHKNYEELGQPRQFRPEDAFGRDQCYHEKPQQLKDDGLWGECLAMEEIKINPNQSH